MEPQKSILPIGFTFDDVLLLPGYSDFSRQDINLSANLTTEKQAKEIKTVKEQKLLAGAAVGASKGFEQRVSVLVKAGADVIVVDSAHGFSKGVIESTSYIKKNFKVEVIAGNIATADGAKALISAGVDGLRVGMGPGAICTTRIISGRGVPQITAIFETVKAARLANA